MARIVLKSSKGKCHAIGEYSAQNVVVLKGSKINMHPPADVVIRPSIQKLRQNKTIVSEDGTVLYDTSFDSISKATMFVLGYSEDGMRYWKTEDEKSIRNLEKQSSEKKTTTRKKKPSITEAPLPSKERGKTPFKRLRSKILREIRKKKFLGDIAINEDEYALLVKYCRELLSSKHVETRLQNSDVCLTVGLVQIGIHHYDGNFWRNAARELNAPDLKKAQRLRNKVSDCVSKTFEKYEKLVIGKNEIVQNVLMHGYVSNHYADQYFDFLYAFYRLDLGRNITLMDSDSIRALFDSIADSTSARTYMIREQVKDAILANPRGCKLRLRKHLKLIDNYFWNENYRLRSNNRIYTLLQEWVEKNNHFESERTEFGIRRRGQKAFSKPYLFCDFRTGNFSIRIPGQLLPKDSETSLYWKISINGDSEYIPAQIVETVTAYRTEPDEHPVEQAAILAQISISLVYGDGSTVRSFNIPADSIRFFDDEGYGEKPSNLSQGTYFAFTPQTEKLITAAVVNRAYVGKLTRWYLELQDGDILRLPNGSAVFVGKKTTEGLLSRGKVLGAVAYLPEDDNTKYDIYQTLPSLVLRAPQAKSQGILLQINGKRHKLSHENATTFSFEDGTTDVGYFVDLVNFGLHQDGKYDIHVDIPNGGKRWYSFLLIHKLHIEFDGAPYIFEPRGSVTISCKPEISTLSAGRNMRSKGQFDFEINPNERNLKFHAELSDSSPILEVKIPALFWRYDDGAWSIEQPEEMWHSELPSKIEIVTPCEKAVLHIDDLEDEESDVEQKPIVGEKRTDSPGFIFDTTRLKTYLDADQTVRTIYLDMDQITKRFVQIVTRSTVVQCLAIAHYESNTIEIRAAIIGKANYFADVSFNGTALAEKVPLTEMSCQVTIPEGLRSGEYEIELFEDVADDFGFGEEYKPLGVYTQTLVNPYDMRGRDIELVQIHRETGKKSPLLMRFMAMNLQYMDDRDHRYYSAQVVVFDKANPVATYPAIVRFFNYQTLDRVQMLFDEDGEDFTFLYDAVRRIIVKEEDTGIRRSEQYRRFEPLYDEDVFEVRFIKEAITIPQDLPDRVPTWSSQGKGSNMFNTICWKRPDTVDTNLAQNYDSIHGLSVSAISALHEKGIDTYIQAANALNTHGKRYIFRSIGQNDKYLLAKGLLERKLVSIEVFPTDIQRLLSVTQE